MKVGFVGLGNVGGKLANSLIKNKFDLTVRDLDENLTKPFLKLGAKVASSARDLAEQVDLIITCLPSPKICAEVMEGKNGIIEGLSKDKIWLEMSTTDEAEIKRIGAEVIKKKVNLACARLYSMYRIILNFNKNNKIDIIISTNIGILNIYKEISYTVL